MQRNSKRTLPLATVCKLLCISILLATLGCQSEQSPADEATAQPANKENLPEHIQDLENLTVYSADEQAPDTVVFERETVFESNDKVLIGGIVSRVSLDEKDNVYLLSQKPGFVRIYVFGPDGVFKNEFIREGRGPKEFEAIISMDIYDNKLFLLGGRLQKIAILSLDDYALIDDYDINKSNLISNNLTKTMIAKALYVLDDSTLVVNAESKLLSNEYQKKYLYKIDSNGKLLYPKLFEIKRHRIYETKGDPFPLPFALPVNRSSIISVSDDGNIYTTWTEDFLIKIYDQEGKYMRAIYYPYENAPAQLSDLDIGEQQSPFLSDEKVPETWPAIQNMIVDDENRIWVSTITESDSTFKWLVLNEEGKLIGQFERPGSRRSINPGAPPMIKIKNGYFYEREFSFRENVNRVVKYKINFIPSDSNNN